MLDRYIAVAEEEERFSQRRSNQSINHELVIIIRSLFWTFEYSRRNKNPSALDSVTGCTGLSSELQQHFNDLARSENCQRVPSLKLVMGAC